MDLHHQTFLKSLIKMLPLHHVKGMFFFFLAISFFSPFGSKNKRREEENPPPHLQFFRLLIASSLSPVHRH
jgi:hypothetical protein